MTAEKAEEGTRVDEQAEASAVLPQTTPESHQDQSPTPTQKRTEIDNGNLYRFCDFVRSSGPSGARGCLRGAGHNGPHAFPQWEIVGPFAPLILEERA